MELQDLPEHKFRAMWILRAAWTWRAHAFQIAKPGEEETAFRELLGRLEASKNAGVKAAAQDAFKALEVELKNASTPLRQPEPEGARFSILHLVLESNGGPVDPVHGILAVSPTVDVVWAGTGLYLMKQKGKLRPVWTTDEQSFRFQSVVYDGRYIWAATRHFRKWPTLMVIDPVTEKIWHVGAAEGLPQGPEEQLKQVHSRFVDVVPLGPGRVCAAGSIGRAWVGLVEKEGVESIVGGWGGIVGVVCRWRERCQGQCGCHPLGRVVGGCVPTWNLGKCESCLR